jgi:hypothetical protein
MPNLWRKFGAGNMALPACFDKGRKARKKNRIEAG